MRIEAIVEGDFYQVTRIPPDWSLNTKGKGNSKLSVGMILKCTKKYVDEARWSYNPSYTLMELHDSGGATGTIFKIANHKGIDRYSKNGLNQPTLNRDEEKKHLQQQVDTWTKEMREHDNQVKVLAKHIAKANVRLKNLEKFKSDEEALAYAIKEKLGTDLSDKELSTIVQMAGLSL